MKVLKDVKFDKRVKTAYNLKSEHEWEQLRSSESNREKFIEFYKSVVDVDKLKRRLPEHLKIDHNVLVHVFANNVPEHDDDLCKKTMLIPLKLQGDVFFYCGKSEVKLEERVPVIFNDSQVHSVECTEKGKKQVIASIDYMSVPSWYK